MLHLRFNHATAVTLLSLSLAVAVCIISPLALAEPATADHRHPLAAASSSALSNTSPDNPSDNSTTTAVAKTQSLDIYKSPTCGCCTKWVDHINANGFTSKVHHPDNLDQVKEKYRIAPQYQSCHTAVSPEGYVFEGHIPARVIARFLAEKPKGAIGLAVPGMPVGSPGMEMGARFSPYDVLLLKAEGASEVYTRVTALEESH